MAGVPAGHQTPLLQGAQLGGRAGPGRDHLVEAEPQRRGVLVGPLVLRGEGGELEQPRAPGDRYGRPKAGGRAGPREPPSCSESQAGAVLARSVWVESGGTGEHSSENCSAEADSC